ncbi:hypothetical protein DICSQDRAFT_137814 [Dichomitus squalens LYAD-421 SS1]|uniref:Uncharacterized protein n=2 Tax=Dichomitus squalens TaxID=114155 RepID=R7SVY6_DICSQ|nr:uncharacterized protein DICSQDRAFT_137814 [Dichomitus squalens LYAD-421 SS1]EJF60201.1 hypothetical protein DICSQDRAFT_137814 [Dichomitus squalens LYAD-421 SS1]
MGVCVRVIMSTLEILDRTLPRERGDNASTRIRQGRQIEIVQNKWVREASSRSLRHDMHVGTST